MRKESMKRTLSEIVGLAAILTWSFINPALADGADHIRPYEANPRYWQYEGRPVLLLGGSKDDNLFQIPVKTYGADTGRYGNDRDGIERFWRHVIGGAASARFHRPDSGLGLSKPAIAAIKAARKLESLIRLWDVEPVDNLLSDREANEAYLAARPGVAYALYFPNGGSVALDLQAAPGRFEVRWIDIGSGEWAKRETIEGGTRTTLSAPAEGHWAAAILPGT
ncbi:MAG: hypothetical protein EHM18_14965 [Acidobacteria bacterium]|nr:MAG: hypothetical protein EHM18_14965 [Acidobacteriota bacterium]